MKRPSVAALRHRLGARAIFGLHDPEVPNWQIVRLARLRDLRRMLPFAWASNLFNAVALGTVLWNTVPHWQAVAWLTVVLLIVGRSVRHGARAEAVRPGTSTSIQIAQTARRALLCGLAWSVPPLFFATGGVTTIEIAVCLVVGGVMASAPLTLSAVPLAMCSFVLPVALSLAAMMARTGSAVLTLLPLIYAVSLLAGGLAIGSVALRRRLAETALTDEAEIVSLLLHEFADRGADWLWEIDVRKRLVNVSSRLVEAFGRPAEQLDETPLLMLLAEGWPTAEPTPEHRAFLDLLDARRSFKDHLLPVLVEGERRWWRLSATPRSDPQGRFCGFRGVGSDVTEHRRHFEHIDSMARRDGLTGIDNRTGFHERMGRALARARAGDPRPALMLIDLDRFKAVNDTFGHPAGDALLRAVADRLRDLADENDGCARLGGDEFAMLVAGAGDTAALDRLAEKVREALTGGFAFEGSVLHVGASIGMAVATEGCSVETLMREADVALYRAKRDRDGAPRRFEPEMRTGDERLASLRADLPLAAAREDLIMAYVPVSAADGRLVAFSAMPRWIHPLYGEIEANEFAELLGDGVIGSGIGQWTLHASFLEASRWPESIGLCLALGMGQLLDPRLPTAIRAALALSGVSANRITLALSEPSVADGGLSLDATLTALASTGVRLAIDRAETGFAALRGGLFSALRISPALLEKAAHEPKSATLVRALTLFAASLGVGAIAPSPPDPESRGRASRLGCTLFEGPQALSPQAAHARTLELHLDTRRAA